MLVQLRSSWIIPSRCHNEQRSTCDLRKHGQRNRVKLAAGFHKKTSRKFLPHQPVVLVKCKGQTEGLTPYFKQKKTHFS